MKCPHCGKEHPDDFKVCPYTTKPIEPQFQYCKYQNCDFRSPLPLSAKFCPNCGKPIKPKSINFTIQHHNVLSKLDIRDLSIVGLDCALALCGDQDVLINIKNGEIIAILKNGAEIYWIDGSGIFSIEKDDEVYFIDNNGDKLLSGLKGRAHSSFNDGLCAFEKKIETDYGYTYTKVGFINIKGTYVIQPQFYQAENFHNGYAVASYSCYSNNRYILINTKGEVVLGEFHSIWHVKDDLCVIRDYDMNLYLINTLTNEKTSLGRKGDHYTYFYLINQTMLVCYQHGFCWFKLDKPSEWFSVYNRYIINSKCIYSQDDGGIANEELFHGLSLELIPACFFEKKDGPWGIEEEFIGVGYINTNNDIIISPKRQWRRGGFFHNGLAAVCNNDFLWGYIDINGRMVIDHNFKEAHPFYDEWAVVKKADRYLIIDKEGKIVLS